MTACFSVLSDANGSGSLFIDWNNRVNEVGPLIGNNNNNNNNPSPLWRGL